MLLAMAAYCLATRADSGLGSKVTAKMGGATASDSMIAVPMPAQPGRVRRVCGHQLALCRRSDQCITYAGRASGLKALLYAIVRFVRSIVKSDVGAI